MEYEVYDEGFIEDLEQASKTLTERIEYILKEFNEDSKIFTTDDLVALEYDLLKLFIAIYEPLIGNDAKNHIEVTVKVSLEKSSIGVYPNNLFTALLTTSRYKNDVEPEEIEKNNLYHTENGLLVSFNYDEKTIIKRKAH